MSPHIQSHPIVAIAAVLLTLCVFAVLFLHTIFFAKKYWQHLMNRAGMVLLLIKGSILGFLFGAILSIVAYFVFFLIALIGFPVYDLFAVAWMYLTFVSIFCIWSTFWLLLGFNLALKFLKIDTKLLALLVRVSVIGYCIFVLAIIGVNVLRDSYKYCPETLLCKRPSPYVYVPVQQSAMYQKATITSIKSGDTLVPVNGFITIEGTGISGQPVFLVAGFKNPEQFRFGKEQGTLSLGGIKAGSDGKYSITIEDNMIPKGEVYIAVFTSADSDVPWASVYNAAIVKLIHKDVVLKKPVITSPSNGAVVKEYPVRIVGKALPHYGIQIYQGYEVKDLQCLTLNTYASGGIAEADVNGNFSANVAEGYGARGKRNLRIAALPAELKLSGDDCFPTSTLSDIVVFDYQGKIITQ